VHIAKAWCCVEAIRGVDTPDRVGEGLENSLVPFIGVSSRGLDTTH
jgi:hypothetical protein